MEVLAEMSKSKQPETIASLMASAWKYLRCHPYLCWVIPLLVIANVLTFMFGYVSKELNIVWLVALYVGNMVAISCFEVKYEFDIKQDSDVKNKDHVIAGLKLWMRLPLSLGSIACVLFLFIQAWWN